MKHLAERLRAHGEFPRPPYLNFFTRLDKRKIKHKKIAVFDIETDGFLGKVGGIALTSECDYPTVLRFSNHEVCAGINFFKHLLQKKYNGYITYAHNLVRFDASHLFSDLRIQRWLRRNGYEVHLEKAFAVIRKHKHSWYLADSYRIIQMPLAKVMQQFTPHRVKAELPKTAFSWHDPEWIKRIEDDTLGLYESLCKIRDVVLDHFDVPLSMTTPSTALKAARVMLPVNKVQRPTTKALSWLRLGYSGGRIEIYWQGKFKGHIKVFDINSAYAWALRGEFPLGRGRFLRKELDDGYYIGRCEVSVPVDQLIPPVLTRLFTHAFPVGEFQAMLTKEEVEFARKHGATIRFIEGFWWQHTQPLFRGFIDKCAELRKRDAGSPIGQTVKLMQNGLYGILGLKMQRERMMIGEHAPKGWQLAFNTHTGETLEGVFQKMMVRDSPNAMPHWATIITARVRCRLTEFLLMFAEMGLVPLYAHTDSIWAHIPNSIPDQIKAFINDEYGNLKVEAEGDFAHFYSPGVAGLRTNKIKDGKHVWKMASKGWKATPIDFLSTGKVNLQTQTQMHHMMSALKKSKPGRTITKRTRVYHTMRGRIPAEQRPGPTNSLAALAYNYGYWTYKNWYVDKLQKEYLRPADHLQTPPLDATIVVRHRPPVTTLARRRERAWQKAERREKDSRTRPKQPRRGIQV